MAKQRWQQLAAAGGILFVVLQLTGQSLIQIGGAEPAFSAPAGEIVTFFENRSPQLFDLGGFLSALSAIAFIWFLGALWVALRGHEAEPAWMSLVAVGFGLVAVAGISAGGGGWELAVFRIEEGLTPEVARLLFDQGNFAFASYWVMLAGLLLATGVVALRDGALPRWLGWYSLAAAVLLLVARYFWALESMLIFMPYMLFWLWLIIVSVALIRRAASPAASPVPAAATGNS